MCSKGQIYDLSRHKIHLVERERERGREREREREEREREKEWDQKKCDKS
jgi:hypothetical protein